MRRTLNLLLVVALLFGWQAALLHPLQHVGSDGALVHLEEGPHTGHPDKGEDGKRLSCDALAAIAACVSNGAYPAVAIAPSPIGQHSPASAVAHPAAPVFYPSQAPPLA